MTEAIRRFFARPAERSAVYDKKGRHENIAAFILCLIVSGVFLGICTRSSPLYPLNDWVDSNCFFTVGKAMFNGKVVYRDIYEQKGILLYFIHGLGYLISNTTFLGVFIFEVVSFAFFLYIAYLIARLYTNYAFSLAILPVISWSVLTSVSLRQGDSAEEFCLPYILFAVYALLKNLRDGDRSGIPDNRTVFLMGVCAACILWIKYTMLGIYIGYVLTAVILCIIDKDIKKLLSAALSFILGALAVSLPFLIYFAVNGALDDLFVTYFYNNMFLYTDERTFTDKFAGIFSLAVRGLSYNKLWGIMAYVGLLAFIVDVREPRASLGGLLMYFCHIFFIYWGGIGWYYYSFGMVALSVFGFVSCARAAGYLLDKLTALAKDIYARMSGKMTEQKKRELAGIFDKRTCSAVGYIVTACLVFSLCTVYADKSLRECPNVFYMEQKREDIWQTRFAQIINESEDRTLLNYSCLDLGLYTTANIVPSEKFFARLNIDLPEMKEALERSVREQHTEFVVVRSDPSQFVLYYYELVASETSHVEYEGSSISYHLLRRKDLSAK